MAEHSISLNWARGEAPFTYEAYPRNHSLSFKNGQETITASASPGYLGDGRQGRSRRHAGGGAVLLPHAEFPRHLRQEEADGESYEDDAVGFLENDGGKLWITRVILRPKVVCDADAATLEHIHHLAHEACFIANSVKTEVTVEPR